MSFSAIPQSTDGGQPPRVRIDIGTDDPAQSFTALSVYRDGRLIREQPPVGSSEAVAFDYEAPFGVPVTYSVVGTVAAAPQVVFSTAWPNLSGWTTYAGPATVAGGKLTAGGVSRTVALPPSGVLQIDAPFGTPPSPLLYLGDAALIKRQSAGVFAVSVGAVTQPVPWTSGALTMRWTPSSTLVTTPSGVTTFDTPWVGANDEVGVEVLNGSGAVGGFAISSAGAEFPFAASAVTTAAFDGTWLIHPTKPTLSCQIDGDDVPDLFIDASSGETKAAAAQATILRGIGRKKAVVITSGPRQADEWTLVIGAETIAAKNTIRALVDDQTPLLLRSAPGFSVDLPDDWYSVGDFASSRPEAPIVSQASTLTLPLTPVDEPIVRQGALWTWGDVLMKYATWQDVLDDNATWLDVLAGE
jgi:hypothetical protein